jgi:hypothetical protein
MGAVAELLGGIHVQPEHDPRAHIRKLLADYSEHGTEAMHKMSALEQLALLTEKLIHLQEVEGRCQRKEGLHVNSVLRRILRQDVKTIGRVVERELGMDR